MKEQNIKQVDFAEKLDLTPATLAKYISKKEEHRRDIPNSILSKIALLLSVKNSKDYKTNKRFVIIKGDIIKYSQFLTCI